jgi:hypothetical protein
MPARSFVALGLLSVFAVAGFSPTPAQAILIDNGSTTIDTVAELEWLDVTETEGRSWTQITLGLGGYLADGYHLADRFEVCGLLSSLGDSLPNCTGLASSSPEDTVPASTAATVLALLGATQFGASQGWIQGPDFAGGEVAIVQIEEFGASGFIRTFHDSSLGMDVDTSDANVGIYLVRPWVVPEPSTAFMLATGLAGIAYTRCQKAA